MIKIGEAAILLGLSESEADKGIARNVLNYFGVHGEDAPKEVGKFGKPSKMYDKDQVQRIRSAKDGI